MKKLFALTTIVVLLAVVIPASAAPPENKQCDIWLGMLEKIPPRSPNYQKILDKVEQHCGEALDRLALVALYESTDGDNWWTNDGWLSDTHHCDWYGITCDSSNRVTLIDMWVNRLDGPLPSELELLSNVTWLIFSFNYITSIPPEIENLTNLQHLIMDHNSMTSIPSELGNLPNLYRLSLDYNPIGTIPAELGNLSNLGTLGMEHCNLSGPIPDSLRNLINAYSISFYDNDPSLCVSTQELLVFLNALSNYVGPTTLCGP